jgi:hypothetical protein
LTDSQLLNKVEESAGKEAYPGRWLWRYVSASLGWEVVQLAVHQPLELTILVRVQASQPNSIARSDCYLVWSCARSSPNESPRI